jgi:hypothetical protein
VILWHSNFNIEPATIYSMSSKLKTIKQAHSKKENHYSSYHLELKDRPDFIFNDFYAEIVAHVCKKLSTYERSRYRYSYWMQVYEPGSFGHNKHDHFSGNEMFSWVHFLKPVTKSFHFLIEGEKVYPEQQNPGDFIAFPSWALHAVDGNDTDEERVVIAGNVMFDSIGVDYGDGKQKQVTSTVINQNVSVWSVKDE